MRFLLCLHWKVHSGTHLFPWQQPENHHWDLPTAAAKTALQANNGRTALTEDWPLLFVFLWRMDARMRSQPEVHLRWRLLHSSLNHSPDKRRRRAGSASACSRILQHQQGAKINRKQSNALFLLRWIMTGYKRNSFSLLSWNFSRCVKEKDGGRLCQVPINNYFKEFQNVTIFSLYFKFGFHDFQ